MENKKEAVFPEAQDLYLQQPEVRQVWGIYGDSHIWQPKDGGGIFILVYIILALTFGFTLMTTEIAIGRKTKLSPTRAYGNIDKRFAFIGPISL